MTKANFFVIGAAKAGTSSLAAFLADCPEIFLSPIKEPTHFCDDIAQEFKAEFARQRLIDLQSYLDTKPRPAVHQYLVESRADYQRLFEDSGDYAHRGECSTYYLPSRTAAQKIAAYNPDARIIMVERDPIARIRSHYQMDWRTGVERRPLKDCIDEEIALGAAANFENCRMYVSQSRYQEHLKRYQAVFAPEQILTLRFEDLVREPEKQLGTVLAFLGIEAAGRALELGRENSSGGAARSAVIDRLLYRTGLKRMLSVGLPKVLPGPMKRAIKSLYFGKGAPAAPVGTEWQAIPEVAALQTAYSDRFSPAL